MAVHERYLDEVWNEWRYWATWLPTEPLRIGMVGRLTGPDWIFRYESDLNSEYGIDFDVDSDDEPGDYEHLSSGDVSVYTKAAGKVDPNFPKFPKVKAAARFDFHKRDAVVFRAVDCYEDRMKDQRRVKQAILQIYKLGGWPEDAVLITDVVRASAATVIIGGSEKASITLKGSGEANASGHLDIAASASVAASVEKDIASRFLAAKGVTPLYRWIRLRKQWPWGHKWSDGLMNHKRTGRPSLDGPSPSGALLRIPAEQALPEISPARVREEEQRARDAAAQLDY